MKYEQIANLRPCPICGSEAHLRKNASKRFQVKCKKCRCCTDWVAKTDAVVMWYNNAELYERMKGGDHDATNRGETQSGASQAGE